MSVQIKAFGKIAEVCGWKEIDSDHSDTLQLKNWLEEKYPALKNTSYRIAVNQEIILKDQVLPTPCEVALLPPFSGG